MKQIARWNLKMLLGTASIEAVPSRRTSFGASRRFYERRDSSLSRCVVGAFDSFFPILEASHSSTRLLVRNSTRNKKHSDARKANADRGTRVQRRVSYVIQL